MLTIMRRSDRLCRGIGFVMGLKVSRAFLRCWRELEEAVVLVCISRAILFRGRRAKRGPGLCRGRFVWRIYPRMM